MCAKEELIEFALEELSCAPATKPWMTAESLARRIHRKHGVTVAEDELEVLLEAESARSARRIRYSVYPSARSLKILWGAISVVTDRRLPGLVLSQGDSRAEPTKPATSNHHIVFISHNHHDRDDVFSLCDEFEKSGIPAWIFETRIQEGETIIHEVRDAIEHTPVCILFLSRHSIGSTWVRKEVLNARGGVRIVVKSTDRDLLAVINQPDIQSLDIPDSLLVHCTTQLQKENAGKLLDYVHDCFVRQNHPIYAYGSDSEHRDIVELISEIKHTYIG